MSEITLKRTRLGMKDYGVATGEAGMLEWAWVSERMAKARNYWVSSTRSNGKPHAAPVWGVWLDEKLYFGTGKNSVKGRNISSNPSVVVHTESGDEVVIFEGVLEPVEDVAVLRKMAAVYGAKYPHTPDPENEPDSAYYVLRPQVVMAWLENDFPNTATKWIQA